MRAEHYKMKEAIHLGHQLVDEEDEDDDSSTGKAIPPVPVIPASISSNLKKYGAPAGKGIGATRVKDDDEESLDMEL